MSSIPQTPTRLTRAQSKLLSPEPTSAPLFSLAPGTPRFAAPPSPPTISRRKPAVAKVASPLKIVDKGKGRADEEVIELEDSDDSSSEESSSEEDSDSEEESSEGDSESEIEDEEAYLEGLLASAYSNAERKEAEDAARKAGEEVVLELEGGGKEVPLPDLTVPALPTPYLNFDAKTGRATLVSRPQPGGPTHVSANSNAEAGSSKQLELDNVVLPAPMSKKAAKADRAASAPLPWGSLPPIPPSELKSLTREYHALKLRNSLDPKRFYKGQGSTKHVPEVFAIGTLHTPSTRLSLSTLEGKSQGKASVVRELVGDEEARRYAKRKFGVLQGTRERNGRGMGWKKKKTNF